MSMGRGVWKGCAWGVPACPRVLCAGCSVCAWLGGGCMHRVGSACVCAWGGWVGVPEVCVQRVSVCAGWCEGAHTCACVCVRAREGVCEGAVCGWGCAQMWGGEGGRTPAWVCARCPSCRSYPCSHPPPPGEDRPLTWPVPGKRRGVPPRVGARGPHFPARWPIGAFPSPSLLGTWVGTWGTGMGQGHGEQGYGRQRGSARWGGRSLVPCSHLQLHPSLPGVRGFLHLTKARFSAEIKPCRLCFVQKRQQQLSKSLSEAISRQTAGRGVPEPFPGMRNRQAPWPLGCCVSPRTQHPPQDHSIPPRTTASLPGPQQHPPTASYPGPAAQGSDWEVPQNH